MDEATDGGRDRDDRSAPPTESAAEPPAPASEPRTATGPNGRTVAYAEYGAPAGTPLLFLHGTPGSRVLGRLFHETASERGVRVLAPDRPGFGESDPWPGRSLADVAAFTRPVLEDAGVDRTGVVGFSGGGSHALALAATAPDRYRRVDVVAGAAPPGLLEEQPLLQRVVSRTARRAPAVLAGLFRVQRAIATWAPPAAVYRQYTDADVPDPAAETVRDDFVTALAATTEGATREFALLGEPWPVSLREVNVPVVVWHGEDDGAAPVEGARRMADRLPGADLRTLDADHLWALLSVRERIVGEHGTDKQGGAGGEASGPA